MDVNVAMWQSRDGKDLRLDGFCMVLLCVRVYACGWPRLSLKVCM